MVSRTVENLRKIQVKYQAAAVIEEAMKLLSSKEVREIFLTQDLYLRSIFR